uniref:Uncharacterized protein LOC111127057 isoform X2 n=1 Tax=Crassostrea virginica TaxID=6565 RepID=A0A8B8DMC3_CRAVI|nr:uncharacterized protein LOC111127057 isoform X2 [Crassostrea virginica]
MLTAMGWCSCVIVWLLLSVMKMSSSATVTVKKEKLNWTEANEDCQLINVSQLRSVYNSLTSELNVGEGYWIKDSVEKISVVIKGCLTEISIRKSITISTNMLSDCFKHCDGKTIGIKGRNCSCLSEPQSYQYDSRCNVLCLWENSQCKTSEAFSVFQQDEKQLGGKQIEECILLTRDPYIESCTEKFRYICQDEDGNLQEKLDESTWLEAFSKCSKNNTTLANFPLQSPKYSKFTTGNNRFWIGIRQYFNPETLKQQQSRCPGALYFAANNVDPRSFLCNEEKAYICMNDERENGKDSGSSNIAGIVVGVLATIAITLLFIICLFKRRQRKAGSAYQSPVVVYNSESGSAESTKHTPIKPARRSKKSHPESLVAGTAYENIVLSLEDPSTISRVVSSGSTVQSQAEKKDDNYDVMGAGDTNDNRSQNVYGFNAPEGEYDVMNRGNRRVDEQNNFYDHM